jgi:hypothetical protein
VVIVRLAIWAEMSGGLSRQRCGPAGWWELGQKVPDGGASAPAGEQVAVDEVESLGAGEGRAFAGEAAVGDQDDDVGLMQLAGSAVEDLEVGGADGRASEALAAVFALDDPAATVRVSGDDVGAVVVGTADLAGVPAAVAVHQVTYGMLELAVVEGVELREDIAKAVQPDCVQLGLAPPPVRPYAAGRSGQDGGDGQDPHVVGHPAQHQDSHRQDEEAGEKSFATQVSPAAAASRGAPTGRWTAAHRLEFVEMPRANWPTMLKMLVPRAVGAMTMPRTRTMATVNLSSSLLLA